MADVNNGSRYNGFIKSCVHDLRNGKIVYVFRDYQVADIKKQFKPNNISIGRDGFLYKLKMIKKERSKKVR